MSINKENFKSVLKSLDFNNDGNVYSKKFEDFDCYLKVDFNKGEIISPQQTL